MTIYAVWILLAVGWPNGHDHDGLGKTFAAKQDCLSAAANAANDAKDEPKTVFFCVEGRSGQEPK